MRIWVMMSDMQRTTDLITTAEAADILGVTVSTVNRWAVAGRIAIAVQGPGRRGVRMFRRDHITTVAAGLNRSEAA